MKKILVTGGCGFVGSRIAMALSKSLDTQVICFDNLSRRGSEINRTNIINSGCQFIHGDIRNIEDYQRLLNVDFLIDASAEPSVQAGLHDGQHQKLIENNLTGSINLLNFAIKNKVKVIFISTSRVFSISDLNTLSFSETSTRFELSENEDVEGASKEGIDERFSKNGVKSLYGCTKYCVEQLINEYIQYLSLEATTIRCGVISGPGQMGKIDQGIAAFWVTRIYWDLPLRYIGFGGGGKQVRDMLHIDDLCELILDQINHFQLYQGQTLNVGGGQRSSSSLLELTNTCNSVMGKKKEVHKSDDERTADIRIYITNNTKVSQINTWAPKRNVQDIITDIFAWVKTNEKVLKSIFHTNQ